MKLLTLTILSAFFLIGTATTSIAHCGACGESDNHAEMSKPCTKCAEAGKTCGCGDKPKMSKKAPCQKCTDAGKTCGCGDKPKVCTKKMDETKPCKMCDKSEREWNAKKKNMKVMNVNTEKGSLKIIKTKPSVSAYNN